MSHEGLFEMALGLYLMLISCFLLFHVMETCDPYPALPAADHQVTLARAFLLGQ